MALELLDAREFDIVMTDLTLPDSAGLGTFHSLHLRVPHVAVLILYAVEDEALALEAVKGGAQDYIVKGALEPEYLSRTIRYAIVRHSKAPSDTNAPKAPVPEAAPAESDETLPLILHVADPADDRALVEDILKKEPVRLLQVSTGEEGLFKAQVEHPALIFLDLQLPDLQPSDVLRALKEDPATRSIPVVVTVDYVSPRRLQELEEDGASGHLSKPIDRMKFLDEVGRYIQNRR